MVGPVEPDAAVIVRLTGVGVRREGRWILDRLDWTVRSGERWAIVGPNGSGKTTLAQIAATYLGPRPPSIDWDWPGSAGAPSRPCRRASASGSSSPGP